MRRPRFVPTTLLLALLALTTGCSDEPTAPTAPGDTDALLNQTDRQLLVAVLDKLNAMEARLEHEAQFARARFDSLASAGGATFAPTPNGSFEIEASLCGSFVFQADGKLESSLSLWGGGEGMLGVDAYGNGATGLVRGFATQDVKVVPAGGGAITVQLCAKGIGGLAFGGSPSADPAIAGVPPVAGAAEAFLRDLLQSVSVDQLATAAGRLRMTGAGLGNAVDAVSSFSLSDLRFGRGAGAALLGALPMPADVAALLSNPENILQQAVEATQFAVDKVCDQSLFTGPLAQRASQACTLRDQVPSAQSLIGILQGLNGLPATLTSLGSDLADACGAVNAMRPARVTIDPVSVNFPLGIGTVQVFPGFDRGLFPGLGAIC